jgi:hypothetical protein
LINILRGKLREAQYGDRGDLVELRKPKRREDLDDLEVELANLLDEHRHAREEFKHASATLPGVGLARLEHFARSLNPEPVVLDPKGDPDEMFDRALLGLVALELPVQKAVAGEHLDDCEQRQFDRVIAGLRNQSELLHTEVVTRLSQEELRKQGQWWRRGFVWIAQSFGQAFVQIVAVR